MKHLESKIENLASLTDKKVDDMSLNIDNLRDELRQMIREEIKNSIQTNLS